MACDLFTAPEAMDSATDVVPEPTNGSNLPTEVLSTSGHVEPLARPDSAIPPTPRPLIAEQASPRSAKARSKPAREPKEWFARLRIREDRLARLWVTNLMGRDVVVWSAKEKRWVALLSVPELRHALKTAEIERAQSPRSIAKRPSTVPPARLSQPPGLLPPAPPPPLAHNAPPGTGELRLQSIAQGSSRRSYPPGPFDASRSSLQPSAPSFSSARSSQFPSTYSLPPIPSSRRSWQWRAFERLVWLGAGVLLVAAISGVGSSDEHSSYLEPATVEFTADDASVSRPRALGDWFVVTPMAQTPAASGSPSASTCEEREPSTGDATSTKRNARAQEAHTTASLASTTAVAQNPVPDSQRVHSAAEFDLSLARIALINAANGARGCRGSGIHGRAIVTFAPSGYARAVDLPLLIGEGIDRDCIARSFKSVRVPRFSGVAVAVKKDF